MLPVVDSKVGQRMLIGFPFFYFVVFFQFSIRSMDCIYNRKIIATLCKISREGMNRSNINPVFFLFHRKDGGISSVLLAL